MPAHRGRPKIYTEKTADISFKIGESAYAEIARHAHDHGLSVPMYCAMLVNIHRIEKRDEALDRAREATHA